MTTYQVPRVRTPNLSEQALHAMPDANLRLWLQSCARLAKAPARRAWALDKAAQIASELRRRGYQNLLRVIRGEQ